MGISIATISKPLMSSRKLDRAAIRRISNLSCTIVTTAQPPGAPSISCNACHRLLIIHHQYHQRLGAVGSKLEHLFDIGRARGASDEVEGGRQRALCFHARERGFEIGKNCGRTHDCDFEPRTEMP